MFDEQFLTANSALFDGLTESDLVLPERLVFLKGEVVEGTIVDAAVIEKLGAVKLELKVETGEHAGKLHEIIQFAPKPNLDGSAPSATNKKNWIEFLLAFFTKEQILAKQVDFTKHIGSRMEFTAGEARVKGDKTYQNATKYKLLTTETIPF